MSCISREVAEKDKQLAAKDELLKMKNEEMEELKEELKSAKEEIQQMNEKVTSMNATQVEIIRRMNELRTAQQQPPPPPPPQQPQPTEATNSEITRVSKELSLLNHRVSDLDLRQQLFEVCSLTFLPPVMCFRKYTISIILNSVRIGFLVL